MLSDTSKTCETHSVRTISARRGGGRVITMGFPGLDMDPRGAPWLNPDLLDATLNEAANAGLRLLIVLASRTELPDGAMALLRQATETRRLRMIALPIEDYSVPGEAFLQAWRRLRPLFETIFADNGAIGLCCHHGAGRSGVAAVMCLVETGESPSEAVSRLRNQFPETVENERQYQWLKDYAQKIDVRAR
ncbi:MAG: hypothetical protein KUA43_22965 [Hoeflea sp.]|uniref:hypothetical protein n=1 Tax=Hoeflea sp. TaxID=1940281 RepID=UPI001DB4C81F|nr:hypothetical protein [Hoeflea sp.]MBU4530791.1 hypothetical protein [Alphaproteobacteria bacterium]MBU4545363.1 hypothetical protein [Alphaproteobacteria bacterium]MBU4549413.1 hypothetical protein [Alphaproteobacteria bacterium]MBV1726307.1 hypothetical protein [Hoeflea sp.]MBV1761873.1 hypothetical protein [Hoeflea sp.]